MWFETLTDMVLMLALGGPLAYVLFSRKLDFALNNAFIAEYTPLFVLTGIISAKGTSGTPGLLLGSAAALNILILAAQIRQRNILTRILALFTALLLVPAASNPGIDLLPVLKAFLLAFLLSLPVMYLFRELDVREERLAYLAGFSHFFDASSTYVALNNSLEESRYLANYFIDMIGTEGIFLMKALVVIPVIVFASRKIERRDLRPLLFLMFGYGLVLSVRNLVLVGLFLDSGLVL